jgi:hypothetical protein
MREPKRLLSQGATDFERQLLRSVMDERPSALLRSRMQRGLGLVGPLAWAGNVKAMFAALTTKGVSVAVAGAVAAGGIATGAGLVPGLRSNVFEGRDVFAGRNAAEAPAPERVVQPAPALDARVAPAPEAPTPEAPTPEAEAELGSAELARANSQLREEIALIDSARADLQRGASNRALSTLNGYRKRFPEGILSREASLLRRQAGSRKTTASGAARRRD